MKSNNATPKRTTPQEFQLTPKQILVDKILAILYALWAIANLIIFIPHFTHQQFEEIFPFTTLDWKYYNFITLILFTFFIPECIHYIIKLARIHRYKKSTPNQ